MNDRLLRAGILAAGRGERLRRQASDLKPLARVGEQTLIEHVLRSMTAAGAAEVLVIINEDSRAVRDHVTRRDWPFSLRWIVETTPTSMHSFLRLVETLAADGGDGPFLLSTVDTVTSPRAYADFMKRAPEEVVETERERREAAEARRRKIAEAVERLQAAGIS